ncbi:MAG: FkbM family methyltransferase [Clostridiales bacterium]|nr:FkbM family methyltransferase [Clostridiales bacterium]
MSDEKYLDLILSAIENAKNEEECNVYNWRDTLKKKNVCAFGLGKFFDDTHERLFKMCDVKYLCDNDHYKVHHFSEIEKFQKMGIKCIYPHQLKEINDIFVIAVVGNYEPIRKQMEQIGIDSIHITEMHFKDYSKGIGNGWLTAALPQIKEALSLLSDEKSKEVFTSVFCNKISRKKSISSYEELFSEGEYFKTGIFTLSETESFVDAGAFIGDTIDDFIKVTNANFKDIYSFELDSGNYKKLMENVNALDANVKDRIHLYNYGVWAENTEMWCAYEGDADGCSIVNDQRGERCTLISLDDLLSEKEITIIKMDIEGAENKALEGTKKIIENQKPKLAICVYHRPEDLWEIPLKIKELHNDYRIFLRHHSKQNYTNTVCYAY